VSSEDEARSAHARVLSGLYSAALEAAPFHTVCSLLRVGGLENANWDPFEESRLAFDDFNWILKQTLSARGMSAGRRVGMLMYCQAIEMTAPHEMLANLLRCVLGQSYVVDPFADLARKKGLFLRVPPSAKQKFKRIRELAVEADKSAIVEVLDGLFDDRVRNAFSHSDYVLADSQFRFSEGGLAQQVDVAELDTLIANAFAFYGVFMGLHKQWLRQLGTAKRFHKWPNYEVLELLSSAEEGLYGFSVHFSNGALATYTRRAEGTNATNILFEPDGTINYMVGMLDALEPTWKIDGQPVHEWDALE